MNITKLGLAGTLAGALALGSVMPVFAQDVMADAPVIPMQGNAFNPPQVVVPVGTTVTWANNDQEDHDVVPSDPNFALDPNFISPSVAPGTTWSYTFTVPGTYDYMCDLHADMTAQLVVA
jgi:plastocyanin